MMLGAEWALDDAQPERASAFLAALPAGVARRTLALRLRLKAARLAHRTLEALELARLLAKHQAFSETAAQRPDAHTGDGTSGCRTRRRAIAAPVVAIEHRLNAATASSCCMQFAKQLLGATLPRRGIGSNPFGLTCRGWRQKSASAWLWLWQLACKVRMLRGWNVPNRLPSRGRQTPQFRLQQAWCVWNASSGARPNSGWSPPPRMPHWKPATRRLALGVLAKNGAPRRARPARSHI